MQKGKLFYNKILNQKKGWVQDMDIRNITMSVNARKAIQKLQYSGKLPETVTVHDLAKCDPNHFLLTRGVGVITTAEIHAIILNHNFEPTFKTWPPATKKVLRNPHSTKITETDWNRIFRISWSPKQSLFLATLYRQKNKPVTLAEIDLEYTVHNSINMRLRKHNMPYRIGHLGTIHGFSKDPLMIHHV